MSEKQLWILYDARAIHGATDDASVLCTATSLEEARRHARDYGTCAIYEYDVEPGDPPTLTNERLVGTQLQVTEP